MAKKTKPKEIQSILDVELQLEKMFLISFKINKLIQDQAFFNIKTRAILKQKRKIENFSEYIRNLIQEDYIKNKSYIKK